MNNGFNGKKWNQLTNKESKKISKNKNIKLLNKIKFYLIYHILI